MPESNGQKLRSYVCVYLVIMRGEEILLSLRENTKFEDKNWSLIAGHVEEGESASQAMIREAEEEANIKILPQDLNVIYTMDRTAPQRQNIDIFFKCSQYSGEIKNKEPHKCGGIQFFNINNLPENTVNYIKAAISDISSGEIYREFGYNYPLDINW